MIELFLAATLFGSFVWFSIFTVALIIILFLSEGVNHGGLALFAVAVYGAFMYFAGSIDPSLYSPIIHWIPITGYLLFGFLFAYIRTYYFGLKEKKEFEIDYSDYSSYSNEEGTEEYNKAKAKSKKYLEKDLTSQLKGKVGRWIIIWPVSGIFWLGEELLPDVWNKFWKSIGKTFDKVFVMGFKN